MLIPSRLFFRTAFITAAALGCCVSAATGQRLPLAQADAPALSMPLELPAPVLQGGVKTGAGMTGSAYLFDGTNGVVRLPDADALKLTGAFSLSAWVFADVLPDNPTGYGQIVFRGDSRFGYDPYFLALDKSGNLIFHLAAADNRSAEIAAPFPLHQFVYVTASLDDTTGLMRLSLNNRLAVQAQTDIRPFRDLLPDWNPGVGIGNTQDAGVNEPFHGVIDQVRFYDTVIGPVTPPFRFSPPAPAPNQISRIAILGNRRLPQPASHTFEIDVQAYIDGNSRLILKGSQIFWHHFAWTEPGKQDGHDFSTIITTKMDGVEIVHEMQWMPQWQQAGQGDTGLCSAPLTLQMPPMPPAATLVTMQTLADREGLRLSVPAGAQSDTLALDFDDGDAGGAAWYHVRLKFEIGAPDAPGTPLTGAASLEGVADLGAVVTPASPLTFEFREPGTTQMVLPPLTAVLTPIPGSPYGTFHLLVPPGTYDIAMKEAHTLRRVFHSVRVDGFTTLTNAAGRPALLIGGDAGGHNAVGLDDFLIFAGEFGNRAAAGRALPAVDFNHDGLVDSRDFDILFRNLGETGDE